MHMFLNLTYHQNEHFLNHFFHCPDDADVLIADIMTYIQGAGIFYVSISFSLIFQSAQLTPLSSRTTGILMLAS